jgi:hypothetical protein
MRIETMQARKIEFSKVVERIQEFILDDYRKTGLYSEEQLRILEEGCILTVEKQMMVRAVIEAVNNANMHISEGSIRRVQSQFRGPHEMVNNSQLELDL